MEAGQSLQGGLGAIRARPHQPVAALSRRRGGVGGDEPAGQAFVP